MTEKLIGPALDFEGIIFTGRSHLDVIERIYRVAICIEDGRRMVKLADIGFVTNTGRFVGRVEAKRIAQEVGQPLPWHTGRKRPFASPDGAVTPPPAGDGFRFCPELFAHRASVIESLEDHGIYWLSDYAAVDLLRANGFKTFIVSGGGIEFMRPWMEKVYGIPPEQVVGSSIKTKFEIRDGQPVLVRLPELNFNDDKEGKPVGINQHIGRKPVLSGGNVFSGGDIAMLRYCQSHPGATLQLMVNHDDAVREFAYAEPDNASLHAAAANGWTVVNMKTDWNTVFPSVEPSVTAIDILLEPDATMLRHSEANNARLLKVFPKGFALDASHRPHITLVQRFVRTADLNQVYAAAYKVLASGNVNAMRLDAFKDYYIPSKANGLAGIVARPTPELLQLQTDLIGAVAPFTVETGDSSAFVTTPDDPVIDPALVGYVSTFVPKASGEHFNPHITTGVALREYLDQMLAEAFAPFTFSPAGAAVYQLGQFGTAARKLKEWDLKP